jgi:DMSO reductase anchor subunit
MAAATVWCTGMIYASLKPIQRWSNGWVAPNYLLLAISTGALLLHALLRLTGSDVAAVSWLTLAALVAAAVGKLGYWRFVDRTQSVSTAETATGLGQIGKVRLLEAPHTEENYLLREMGFRIARKHAHKLRRIAFLAAFALPFLLTLPSLAGQTLPVWLGATSAVLGVASGLLGVAVERWLFFAEAKHTVTLYYGAATA